MDLALVVRSVQMHTGSLLEMFVLLELQILFLFQELLVLFDSLQLLLDFGSTMLNSCTRQTVLHLVLEHIQILLLAIAVRIGRFHMVLLVLGTIVVRLCL